MTAWIETTSVEFCLLHDLGLTKFTATSKTCWFCYWIVDNFMIHILHSCLFTVVFFLFKILLVCLFLFVGFCCCCCFPSGKEELWWSQPSFSPCRVPDVLDLSVRFTELCIYLFVSGSNFSKDLTHSGY